MNKVTDGLQLVRREEGRGNTFNIFRRKRAEQYGFSLVIFRRQAYLGSIPSSDIAVEGDISKWYDKLKIKDGDLILSINLGPQTLEIRDMLTTKDGWTRHYYLNLDICVIDPIKFAQRYVQETDPVDRAKTAIEGFVQLSAGSWEHDDLNDLMLREFAEKALTIDPNPALGLKVLRAQKAQLFLNPDYQRELEIKRKRKLDELDIQQREYLNRVQEQERINLETVKTQGQIDLERMKTEERRVQEEQEKEFQRQQAAKQREFESQKALQELAEQLEHQKYTSAHQLNEANQRYKIEEIENKHNREMEMYNLLQDVEKQVHNHRMKAADAALQLETSTKEWENGMRRALTQRIGEAGIDALATHIREQIEDNEHSLREAIGDKNPDFQYLHDILLGGSGGSIAASKAPLEIAQNANKVSAVPNKEEHTQANPKQEQDDAKPVHVLPGVTRQKEDAIEILDLGLRLVPTVLSEDQCARAGISTTTSFLVFAVNERGSAKDAHLQVGDIVIELNGTELQTIPDISNAVSSRETGVAVSLCVLRGEALIEVQVSNPQ